ncbi:TM1266 family iron-only hydrogenase system putative regulator [Saccharicrinis sp. FJH62]|uniref:TM1266 family iron-only hydrogenase system putative regulator n=1 Tax=Saccharicrinis sp. FJH62 TaxID=3344657 RepID=UPI0035D3ECB5
MEKRIGALLIVIKNKDHVQQLNAILSEQSPVIIARQGIPLKEKSVSIISLVVEGTTDEISTLSGKLGRLEGITVKSVLAKD